MARRSRSSRASSSRRSASTPQRQSQVPVQSQPQVPAVQKQPGLLAQAMSTATGVAVGHTIGSGISNALFGGRSSEPEQQQTVPPPEQHSSPFQSEKSPDMCKPYQDQFTKCMESNNQNFESCRYFYDMMRSCAQ
eukprot:NODE_285_length_11794_cov_0.197178.p8 type:complete len:135 gc:universal NODE_285_length_11794_cov_0.197178:5837-5433(-)